MDLAEIYKETKLVDAVYIGDRKIAGMRSFEQTRWHLKPLVEFFGLKNIRNITAGDVQKYKTHRLNTPTRYGWQRAIASVNRELVLLRSMFNFARAESWIIRSPFESKGSSLISLADEKKRVGYSPLEKKKDFWQFAPTIRKLLTYGKARKLLLLFQ